MEIIYFIVGALVFIAGFKIGKGEKIEMPKLPKFQQKREISKKEKEFKQGWDNIQAHLSRHGRKG